MRISHAIDAHARATYAKEPDMFHPSSRRSAVAAALISLGLAVGVSAQTPSQSQGGVPSAPPAAGSTGMDKGAGTASRSTATTAPSSTAAAKAGATALSGGERRFLEDAARGDMAEIEMSKLAQQNAQSSQVKDYAKRIIDDHTKSSMELKKVASSKNVSLPAEMDGSHKRKMDRLAKKKGTDFDKAYMDQMVDDHQKEVREFRGMAKNAKDGEVKAFAAKTLPVLEQHLQMAKAAEDALRQAGRKGPTQAGTDGGTARSTATPGKDTAATTGTAGPGTGMPPSTRQQSTGAPQPPGGPADTRTTTPPK
jgi:putative membrane protein